MIKLEIFIPCSHLDALREALHSAGAGMMGNYDNVMGYSPVKGFFRPLPGACPYDGEIGVLTETDELKVEVCCETEALAKTVTAIRAVHPYEVPVINAISLLSIQ